MSHLPTVSPAYVTYLQHMQRQLASLERLSLQFSLFCTDGLTPSELAELQRFVNQQRELSLALAAIRRGRGL